MKRNVFKNNILKFFLLLITFFTLKSNFFAASFKYSDFNWDEFSSQNKAVWVTTCLTTDDPNCEDRLLKTKKEFYTRLYYLLAKVENDVGFIDDNYIIATVFFGFNPDSFKDPTGTNGDNAYNVDYNDKDSYVGTFDSDDAAKAYFEKETDTLKTLINSFIGYNGVCYGYTNEEVLTDSNNNKYCSSGNPVVDGKCSIILNGDLKGNFFDSIGLNFSTNSVKNRCLLLQLENGYTTGTLKMSSKREVNVEYFWDFLENTTYFDKKKQFQEYYVGVFGKTKYNSMIDILNSYERDAIYKQYNDEIINIRKRIITYIKEIVKNYQNISSQYNNVNTPTYWWPIGGDSVNSVGLSDGDPTSVNIISNYKDNISINGTTYSNNGVDISGDKGVTTVIASQSGLVVSIIDNNGGDCASGDTSCGSGYGNYVIIEQTDGNFAMYGYLDQKSITVKKGDYVNQGQFIGKVGDTGNATQPSLHFEIRKGNNDTSSTINPLNYINASEPRKKPDNLSLVKGGNNQETVCLTLKNSNMSNNGVVALMTNINAESSFNPTLIGDNGTSYGLCQWHNERWTSLKNAFPSNWQSVDGQLSFLFKELSGGYASLYSSLNTGSDSASKLTYNFCYYFERPANKTKVCNNRANNSSSFLNYVNNGCK